MKIKVNNNLKKTGLNRIVIIYILKTRDRESKSFLS